jgi:probable F420-dependent oxidoreductase
MILPQRNPVILAKAIATLDSFCDGRVILGVGVGWAKEESDAVGADFSTRGKRTDEAVAVMRSLWREGASSHAGSFHAFQDAFCFPKPARPGGVPVLIGGESRAAMKRVASLGDGWLPFNLPVDRAAGVIADLKAMTSQAGRDPGALRIIKIIYGNATLDDLARYRDAGVTEFNLASSGDLPFDESGIQMKMEEFRERLVGPIAELELGATS